MKKTKQNTELKLYHIGHKIMSRKYKKKKKKEVMLKLFNT